MVRTFRLTRQSLPQLFAVGIRTMVVVAVQGAPRSDSIPSPITVLQPLPSLMSASCVAPDPGPGHARRESIGKDYEFRFIPLPCYELHSWCNTKIKRTNKNITSTGNRSGRSIFEV